MGSGTKFLKKGMEKYQHSLEKNFVITNVITAFFVYMFGNFLSQSVKVYRGSHVYNIYLLLIMGAYGMFHSALGSNWLRFLEFKFYPLISKNISFNNKYFHGFMKMFLEQTLWYPISTLIFITLHSLYNRDQPIEMIKLKFLRIYKIALIFWSPIIFINFTFVEHKYRQIVVNIANIAWSFLLTHIYTD